MKLTYGKKSIKLRQDPLHSRFKERDYYHFRRQRQSSLWEIKDDCLLLTRLHKDVLKHLFPGKKLPILADWYSEEICIPEGKKKIRTRFSEEATFSLEVSRRRRFQEAQPFCLSQARFGLRRRPYLARERKLETTGGFAIPAAGGQLPAISAPPE